MLREDYVLRMIAQMARVIAAIRRKLAEGKHGEAGDDLQRAAQQGGLDLELVIALDEPSLEPLLRTGGEIDRPKCAFFGELLYLEWKRQHAMGNAAKAERCGERAALLFALAYDGIVMPDEARQHLAEIERNVTE